MANTLAFEIWRLIGILFLALFFGILFGHAWEFIALALGGYLFWHIRKINVLYGWLKTQSLDEPPEGSGIWGEVFDEFYSVQQKDFQHKQNLTTTLVRLQQVVSALPDGAIILQEQNEIDWCNDAAKRLLGIKLPQDLGYIVTNIVRVPVFVEYLTQGDFSEWLEMSSPIDDTVHLSIRVIPVGKDQKMLLVRDLSRMLRLEQMRKDFVANISHELRTPLTVVNGYLETLSESEDPHAIALAPRIIAMRQQVDRMRNIVNDLLLLSRLETKTMVVPDTTIDVNTMLNDIRQDAGILSGEHQHDIVLEAEPALSLRGNFDELHSAFTNLVSNAVRYTPSQGKISIRWYRESNGVCLEVRDTGIGIAPHDIPRLTERFYRADAARSRETGGTGLGLAIVKHVLNRHNAKLSIDSTIGEGSVFRCHFPKERVVEGESSVTKLQ